MNTSNHMPRTILALALLALVWSCADDADIKGGGQKGEDGKTIEVLENTKEVEGIDSFQGLKGTGFVVKNYIQLKSAAEVCLGQGLGAISDDMFAAGRCPNAKPAGEPEAGNEKLVILGADKCAYRNQNIYDVLKDQLWSPDLAGRTDTLANQLTPSYLQALATAADVYAHTVYQPANLCDSKDKTEELVNRCLSQYSGGDLDPVVESIHELCTQGTVKAREALATILGSAAFASAVPRNGEED
jgi:hypothetical protein